VFQQLSDIGATLRSATAAATPRQRDDAAATQAIKPGVSTLSLNANQEISRFMNSLFFFITLVVISAN
jgi:hypothetical protein